eukprot:229606-Prymnesium_polylepis.1
MGSTSGGRRRARLHARKSASSDRRRPSPPSAARRRRGRHGRRLGMVGSRKLASARLCTRTGCEGEG